MGHHRAERTVKGVWYKCYVVIGTFSLYVTGWLVAAEDAIVAKDFLADAIARNRSSRTPSTLTGVER